MRELKPSDLHEVFPWSSIHQNSEAESSMAWMILKLEEYGDEFREVPYTEYRDKWDGIRNEEGFEQFQRYLKSADTIILYSPAYQEVADKLRE